MLKKIRLLFLGLVVIAGSACVTPTYASSAPSVFITYIQPAGPGGAKEELVILHNNSATAVDITDWCLVNKTGVAFACFADTTYIGYDTQFTLLPYQSVTVGSQEYISHQPTIGSTVFLPYEITHQSNGSIVNSTDTVTLVDALGATVDAYTWQSAPSKNMAWTRIKVLSGPDIYASTGTHADWTETDWTSVPESGVETYSIPDDSLGTGSEENQNENESEGTINHPPSAMSALIINEIFPNAQGADTGKEFIEMYNTSATETLLLDGLQLYIGVKNPKQYLLPSGISLAPGEYRSFSDEEVGFTLVNTHGKVQLYYDNTPLGEGVEYTSPKDGWSWAFIDETWQYTNQLTPGVPNLAPIETGTSVKQASLSQKKPCASNQFRNPETGRCKLIAVTKAPTPCKVGYKRNTTTNRCRKIVTANTSTPCKDGWERNAETNRCRKIKEMTTADYGVKGVQAVAGAQLNWYYWVAIGGVLALVLGYAVWEWRQELLKLWRRAIEKL